MQVVELKQAFGCFYEMTNELGALSCRGVSEYLTDSPEAHLIELPLHGGHIWTGGIVVATLEAGHVATRGRADELIALDRLEDGQIDQSQLGGQIVWVNLND